MTIKHLYPNSRPTLDLKFAKDKTLDPRITFTRASSGTYVDEDGVIQSAATNEARFDHDPVTNESLGLLVEESRVNNLSYSTNFDNIAWTKTRSLIAANATTAPDGTITADKLIRGTDNNVNVVFQSVSLAQATYTLSIFAKQAEYAFCTLSLPATQGWDADRWVSVNLADGSYTTSASAPTSTSVVAYPNGWYRISITHAASATVTRGGYIEARSSAGYGNQAGDGTSGIYIWGAQLEAGDFPTSYIPTPATFTSRASTATYYDANGVIQTAGVNVARDNAYFPDENGVMQPAGLLLEGSGTNLLTYSEQFDNAVWNMGGPIAMTITPNAAVAPDGTMTADKFIRNNGATAGTRTQLITPPNANGTFSIYAKAGEVATFNLQPSSSSSFQVTFNVSLGTAYSPGVSVLSYGIQNVGSGWYRCWVTASLSSNYITIETVSPSTGDGTSGLYLWGAQLEASPYATSYIPTAGSTVTRAADVSTSSTVTRAADVAQITGSNFSSWYNQSEGSWFVDSRGPVSSSNQWIFALNPSGTGEDILYRGFTGGLRSLARYRGDVFDANTAPSGQFNKASLGYQLTSQASSYFNTVSGIYSSIAGYTGTPTSLAFGLTPGNSVLNGHIARLTYFPTRLSNAILQNLTT